MGEFTQKMSLNKQVLREPLTQGYSDSQPLYLVATHEAGTPY